jgi:hypothetical protein
MSDIIKALKENETPFGMLSDEIQMKAMRIGKAGNFEFWNETRWALQSNKEIFRKEYTYRLRPDYEEKPEIVECEIYVNKDGYLEFKKGAMLCGLQEPIDNPDFIGFKYEDERSHEDIRPTPLPRLYMDDEGNIFSQYKEGYEVLTPTHVCFRSTK